MVCQKSVSTSDESGTILILNTLSAYYFWNEKTGETTWTNPLVPPPASNPTPDPTASSSSSSTAQQPPLPEEQPPLPEEQPPLPNEQPPLPGQPPAIDPNGLPPVDPALAHLLPKSQQPGAISGGYQSASFNARTGRFTPANYQFTPDHLAEANRARRQGEVFFDVDEWEKQRESQWAQGAKRKGAEEAEGSSHAKQPKLTKADMDRFRRQKQEKKARNNAWLKG